MRERYYPHLIHKFYGSLARRGDGWEAIVQGIHIPISDELVSEFRAFLIADLLLIV